MGVIGTVYICGIPHKVVEVDDVFDAGHFGQIEYKTATIKITKDLTPELKEQTLCHEIVHGILTHLGDEEKSQDEHFVQILASEIWRTFLVGDFIEIEKED